MDTTIKIFGSGNIDIDGQSANMSIFKNENGQRLLCKYKMIDGVECRAGSEHGLIAGQKLADVTHFWHKPEALKSIIRGFYTAFNSK